MYSIMDIELQGFLTEKILLVCYLILMLKLFSTVRILIFAKHKHLILDI